MRLVCLIVSLLLAACNPAGESGITESAATADAADARRLAHVQELAAVIGAWHSENGQLPPALAALGTVTGLSPALVEALKNREIDYEVLGNEDYTLCARFNEAIRREQQEDFWNHGPGEHCFRLSPTYGQY